MVRREWNSRRRGGADGPGRTLTMMIVFLLLFLFFFLFSLATSLSRDCVTRARSRRRHQRPAAAVCPVLGVYTVWLMASRSLGREAFVLVHAWQQLHEEGVLVNQTNKKKALKGH